MDNIHMQRIAEWISSQHQLGNVPDNVEGEISSEIIKLYLDTNKHLYNTSTITGRDPEIYGALSTTGASKGLAKTEKDLRCKCLLNNIKAQDLEGIIKAIQGVECDPKLKEMINRISNPLVNKHEMQSMTSRIINNPEDIEQHSKYIRAFKVDCNALKANIQINLESRGLPMTEEIEKALEKLKFSSTPASSTNATSKAVRVTNNTTETTIT